SAMDSAAASRPPRWALGVSVSSAMRDLCEFGFFGCRQAERRGDGELLARLVAMARPPQRLAPFEMQPAPAGRVVVGFLEFGQREVRAVLGDQRLAPQLQRIGKMRAFPVRG